MRRWNELTYQEQEDLLAWYNRRDPDEGDKKALALLLEQRRFQAWDCPMCGDRVYAGSPEKWDDFQGTLQVDYMSYPGQPEIFQYDFLLNMCDDCRRISYLYKGSDYTYTPPTGRED